MEEHPIKKEPTLEEDEWLLKWTSGSDNVKKEVKLLNSDSNEDEGGRHVTSQNENGFENEVLIVEQTSVENLQAIMGMLKQTSM